MNATSRESQQRRALVVLTDPAMRKLCCDTLGEAGFVVVNGIESGAAALTTARELRPDVILLSQQLGDVPAGEAVKWLRSNEHLAATAIIILGGTSNNDNMPIQERVYILPRPVTVANIRHALAAALPPKRTPPPKAAFRRGFISPRIP